MTTPSWQMSRDNSRQAGFIAIMLGGIMLLTLNQNRTGFVIYIVGIVA
jgi:hypothetical protein